MQVRQGDFSKMSFLYNHSRVIIQVLTVHAMCELVDDRPRLSVGHGAIYLPARTHMY